ncbi:MAG: PASTA domain-containing protein, partial [Candidatus Acidiferrales bacterium]
DTLRAGRTPSDQMLADVSDFDPGQGNAATPAGGHAPPAPVAAPDSPAPTLELSEGAGIPIPNFEGKSVRDVTQECIQLGLDPVLVGTGIASQQSPEPGTSVRRGTRITVQFGRSVPDSAELQDSLEAPGAKAGSGPARNAEARRKIR